MLALQHLCLSCGHGYVLSFHHDGHLPERGWKVMSVWCPRLEADLGHPCSSTSSSFPVLGTGQVEAVLTACLCAADGSSLPTTDKAALERAKQPPSVMGSGPPRPAPLLWAGHRVWALLPHTLRSGQADKARLLWWAYVLEPAGRAAITFSGPR